MRSGSACAAAQKPRGLRRRHRGEPQHVLADDVLVDLGGAAGDGGLAHREQVLAPAVVVDERLHADQVDGERGQRLVVLRPGQLGQEPPAPAAAGSASERSVR